MVRIYSYIFCFIHKLKVAVQRKRDCPAVPPLMEGAVKFSIFSARSQRSHQVSGAYFYFAEFAVADSPHGYFALSQCEKNVSAKASAIHV